MSFRKKVREGFPCCSLGLLVEDTHLLSSQELKEALKTLKGWKMQEGQLKGHFCFKGFESAFAFVSQLAVVGQRMGHSFQASPIYNNVLLQLTTPEQGGITQLDITLAHLAEQLAQQLKGIQIND